MCTRADAHFTPHVHFSGSSTYRQGGWREGGALHGTRALLRLLHLQEGWRRVEGRVGTLRLLRYRQEG